MLATFAFLIAAVQVPSASAAGDITQATCPNEANTGFSSALPECRAYEQVSPVFKNGRALNLETQGLATGFIFPGGDRLATSVFAGVLPGAAPRPGGVNTEYQTVRGPEGWTTTPLLESSTGYAWAGNTFPPGLANESGEAVLQLHPSSGSIFERHFYKHRPGGAFVSVGPVYPPFAVPPTPTGEGPPDPELLQEQGFEAVSTDLSHVLFTLSPLLPASNQGTLPPGVETELWPGDTTGRMNNERAAAETRSLYEYAGTGNTEPALVGVENEGALDGTPHINDGARLISQCGTFPGGYGNDGGPGTEGNHHNAISENGETVFFTAVGHDGFECEHTAPRVSEVFARIAEAHTVALSEPDALATAEPNDGCKEAGCIEDTSIQNETKDWRGANFEGASANGQKAYFTSTQRLVDSATQDPSAQDGANQFSPHNAGCRGELHGENGCNLYLYDFSRPRGERLLDVSAGDTSGLGPQVQGVAALPEDGSRVFFVAKGVLTGSQANEFGAQAQAGQDNLYVFDAATGHRTFIAVLSKADDTQWPSLGGGDGIESPAGEPMNVTDDGGFLVFTSSARLTPDAFGDSEQVYRYDVATESLTRLSIGNEGFNDNGNAADRSARIALGGSSQLYEVSHDLHPAVSEDGSVVVFMSTTALTPGALSDECVERIETECTEVARHAYEYRDGHVYLIARNVAGTSMVGPSGQDVYFETGDPLVPSDTDNSLDIYDARVDGGFATPSTPAPCGGEACQGSPVGPPPITPPGSSSLAAKHVAPPTVAPPRRPTPKSPTREQKLAKALKACRRKHKHERRPCEAHVERLYDRHSAGRHPGGAR